MADPAANPQISSTGKARKFGIPALAVQFLGNDGSTSYVLSVFGDVQKSPDAAVQTGVDNNNEVTNLNRSQRKRNVKFSAKAESDTIANAKAIADNLPMKMDIVNIGHMTAGAFVSGSTTGAKSGTALDPQIETAYAIVESATARYSPEGELAVDFDLTIHLNPDGSFKVWAAVT